MTERQEEEPILRDARPNDLALIQTLLESLGLPKEGVMEHLEHFMVLMQSDRLIGTIGLEVYGKSALLRSLGVAEGFQSMGLGRRLCEAILEKAKSMNISEIYLLTETAEGFFRKYGFERIPREDVNRPVSDSVEFRSCCPVSASCMKKHLEPSDGMHSGR